MKYAVLFILLLTSSALATDRTSDGSLADTQAKNALCVDGDRLIIPSGTYTWAGKLTVTKAITVQGAGVGVTILKDNGPAGTQMIAVTLVAGKTTRVTGIEFQNGARATTLFAPKGVLQFNGSSSNGGRFRWDHSKWNGVKGYPIFHTALGVVDHVEWNTSDICLYLYDKEWSGGVNGDKSWAESVSWGTDQFTFFEDCTVTVNGTQRRAFFDSFGGGRVVVRYNTMSNVTFSFHGTESTHRTRGGRAAEIYSNTITGGGSTSNIIGDIRSGTYYFHDNTISGYGGSARLNMNCHRTFYPFTPWDNAVGNGADGTNAWDLNDVTNQTGNGYGGGTSGLFATVTASGASSGQTVTVTHTGTWSTDQWVGYTLRRTTNLGSATTIHFGEITANTANSLTYTGNGGYTTRGLAMTVANGDTLEIHKVIHALDQPGVSGGTLIPPGATPTPPAGWYNQTADPCYSWSNTQEAGAPVLLNPVTAVVMGENYVNGSAPPGYTPYTYPHPLTGSATGAIIVLTGNMLFGNVIIGDTPTATLTVSNSGDTTMTVTSVSYPSGFTGATSGFSVSAGSSHDITVTFTPLTATTYSGFITVAGNATGGTNTIAVSGTGVAGNNQRPFNVYQIIKNILSRYGL